MSLAYVTDVLSNTVNVLVHNPVTNGLYDLAVGSGVLKPKIPPVIVPATIIMTQMPLWQLAREASPLFLRLAGLSGASAVVLGAYGAHKTYPESKADLKKIFETANRFHFIHTLALLGSPLCKYPTVSGVILVAGMTLFCGTCYYHAFTGDNKFGKLAPFGGTCLIFAWLAMIL